MTKQRKSADEMQMQYPDNLEKTYTKEQVDEIQKYYETLEENQKTIMSVVINYMSQVSKIINNGELKEITFRTTILDEELKEITGMHHLNGTYQVWFDWISGPTGFCDIYDEINRTEVEFFPFGKDNGLDTEKVGKQKGMSLFVTTILKHKIKDIQSKSYEPEFMKLIQRGSELGILNQTGSGYGGEVVATSNLDFISDRIREVLTSIVEGKKE